MSEEQESHRPHIDVLTPAANLFSLGSELLNEVQGTLGSSKVKALRLSFGDRTIREIPVSPLTAIATLALVIGAILVSNLKIEIVKEPLPGRSGDVNAPGGAS
jgi:hypothetical protein